MAVPAWFDYNYYLTSKLRQLKKDDPDHWHAATVADVEQAFTKAGYVGEQGAYQHFVDYGAREGADPNPLFCAEEYYTFRAATHFGCGVVDVTPLRRAQTVTLIKNRYGNAWDDYTQEGALEFANASNSFDTKKYLTDKLLKNRDADPAGWGTKTEHDMAQAIHDAGMNPVSHYYLFGSGEGVGPSQVEAGGQAYTHDALPWDEREKLLHNKLFNLSEWSSIDNIGYPKYMDVLLQVTPSCIDDSESGYGVQFNDALVDLKTGTVTEFLLHPRAMQIGTIPLKSFTRKQYNTMLDFAFYVEGRYLGFWTSLCVPAYKPLLYAEPYFPQINNMEYMFGTAPDGNRTYFYALNWGQAEMFDTTKNRILAIYTDGYKRCYWCKPMKVTVMEDPRIVRVDVRDPLPQIYLNSIDVITEYMYVHGKVDELPISFITNSITVATLEFLEDVDYTYDPWLEFPPAYPNPLADVGTGLPEDDKTAPILVTSVPAKGDTNIGVATTLVYMFNESVAPGTGQFYLTGPTGTTFYPANSANVKFSGKSVVISLPNDLSALTNYEMYTDATAVKDLSGNYWPGNSTDPITFQTAQPNIIVVTKPTLLNMTPAAGTSSVPISTQLVLTFSEDVYAGNGYITLSTDDNDGDGYADHIVNTTAASAVISGSTAIVTLPELLHRNTEYYVTITGTAFKDKWGNYYDGISGVDTYRFRTNNTRLVWYLPEIDHGRSAEEYIALQKAYGSRMGYVEYWPMDSFSNNWSEVTDATTGANSRDLFVGVGLGGVYAALLASKYGAQAYLINPVISPATQMVSMLGTRENYDGTQYKLTQGILDTYNSAGDPRVKGMRNRFNLCVSLNDGQVDHAVSEAYYPKYTEWWDAASETTQSSGWANIRRELTASGHLVTDTEGLNAITGDFKILGF